MVRMRGRRVKDDEKNWPKTSQILKGEGDRRENPEEICDPLSTWISPPGNLHHRGLHSWWEFEMHK